LGSVRAAAEQADIPYGKARGYFEYLAAVEKGGKPVVHMDLPSFDVVVFDLETTSLDTFFGRLIVGCFLNINTGDIAVRTIFDYEPLDEDRDLNALDWTTDSRERQLLEWTTDQYEKGFVLIGHNITAFDRHFLQGRHDNLRTGRIVAQALHFDTMQVAKHQAKISPHGYSLENLLDYYRAPVQKDKPSKHEWARSRELTRDAVSRIAVRCVEDVKGNAWLAGSLLPHVKRGPGIKSIR
jgi:DNA polymerase elongation subunit (family B)